MLYTARNGTSFRYDSPDAECVQVIGPDWEGAPMLLNLQDLREFLEHFSEPHDAPTDADASAVSGD
jgi:hypothetical protein